MSVLPAYSPNPRTHDPPPPPPCTPPHPPRHRPTPPHPAHPRHHHRRRKPAPGYEAGASPDVVVISGKGPELSAALKESVSALGEVTVRSGRAGKPLNEFATLSARSFSPEETRRYAASFADPARVVMNFPGVAAASDGGNSIVVRGNSPRGLLWRLEGIEIPNPNPAGASTQLGCARSARASPAVLITRLPTWSGLATH